MSLLQAVVLSRERAIVIVSWPRPEVSPAAVWISIPVLIAVADAIRCVTVVVSSIAVATIAAGWAEEEDAMPPGRCVLVVKRRHRAINEPVGDSRLAGGGQQTGVGRDSTFVDIPWTREVVGRIVIVMRDVLYYVVPDG